MSAGGEVAFTTHGRIRSAAEARKPQKWPKYQGKDGGKDELCVGRGLAGVHCPRQRTAAWHWQCGTPPPSTAMLEPAGPAAELLLLLPPPP